MKWWWRLVQFGFRLLYNEMAFTYDWVSKFVSLGAWRCWQRASLSHLGINPGDLVLELAHGTGDLQLDLHAQSYRTIGYDLSAHMGRIASHKLRKNGIEPRLLRGKAQHLPFAPNTFDVLVCTFPSDFILAPATLSEAHRVIKPGAHLVIVFNGVFTTGGMSERFLEFLYRITGQRDGSDDTGEKALEEAYRHVITTFETAGFTAHVEQEPCPRSIAVVVVAQKSMIR